MSIKKGVRPSFKISDLLGDTPAPVQNQIRSSREMEIGMITGFAAGKTRGICAAAIEHGVRNPGAKVILGRKTYQETINTVKQPFFDMARCLNDAGWFSKPVRWDYREGTNHAQLINGSQFIFSNLDDPIKFRNEEYSMVIVDQAEEINEELWETLVARIRWAKVPEDNRQAIAAANDNGHNWVWRRFVEYPRLHAADPHRCQVNPFCMFQAGHVDEEGTPRDLPCATRRFFHGTTLDNKHNLAPRYLSVLLSHPMSWQQRFIYATMEGGEGRLLPDPVVVPHFDPPPHWPKWRALDHALNSPACCVWLTVNVDGIPFKGVSPDSAYAYREYWAPERSIDQHTRAIMDLSGSEKYMGDVMDRSAFQMTQSRQNGIRASIADLYFEESNGKIVWSPSVGDPFARVERIITAHNRGLVVSDHCKHIIEQMPEYYAEASKSTGLYRIVNKSDFHAVDALGYGLMIIPINTRNEFIADGSDDKPDYLKRPIEDLASRRHHEGEWKRIKQHQEMSNKDLFGPVLGKVSAHEFWGEGEGLDNSRVIDSFDPFGGGRE